MLKVTAALFAAVLATSVTVPMFSPPVREVERDVPYVPTPQPVVDAMLKLAGVRSSDYHIDLGCGDGRIVVTAAKRYGTRGLGVDIDPKRISEARFNAEVAGVLTQVEFRRADLFETDIARADVLTLYLLPSVNMRLRPTILARLKPGTRVVSHDFDMGDWPADQRLRVPEEGSDIYLWIVPANVAGRWRVTGPAGRSHDLQFEQRFQRLDVGGAQGRVTGDRVTFTLPDGARFDGRVQGETITGANGWRAVRIGD
ncbi:SAM-dependent methyltransferase [Sphingomonas lenta]|uniref:SAM-dependent methyltransferase n=1 Tax=Sphingomonas lenta TaxID=1141887 RepID=A0A2A2SBT4_9SPHN|nr:methyltransferase domain-containing protein [Sphingomonas lenta]PAX06718.1 SAM-dependent methyltransferase [Sphingomonas lenta]